MIVRSGIKMVGFQKLWGLGPRMNSLVEKIETNGTFRRMVWAVIGGMFTLVLAVGTFFAAQYIGRLTANVDRNTMILADRNEKLVRLESKVESIEREVLKIGDWVDRQRDKVTP